MYDVCIIGGGVIGTAIARELSRYRLHLILVEKGEDVAVGTTKANSAIVHGGYTAKHGTLKGELSIRGNRMYDHLNRELNFGLSRIGSLVLAFNDGERPQLEALMRNGEKNGVRGLEILEAGELREREPEAVPEAVAALYCPETAVTSPYEFCIALAENAVTNGLKLRLRTEVTGIEKKNGHFRIKLQSHSPSGTVPDPGLGLTPGFGPEPAAADRQTDAAEPESEPGPEPDVSGTGISAGETETTYTEITTSTEIKSAFVVNAAGIYSDRVSAMAGDPGFKIRPRQGQYLVFRRGYGELVKHVIFQTPTEKGKGILVTPTYWGNLLVGPNAEEISDRENLSTNREILAAILKTAKRSIPAIDISQVIRSFSGIRATADRKDFIIEESGSVPGLIQAAGIDSPGLTSSPAIAEMVTTLLERAGLSLERKEDFQARRRGITSPAPLKPMREIRDMIDLPQGNPDRIVCRCEQVRESTILDALGRGIPIDSTDAVKRRTRAGMGACQGLFCTPRVRSLIAAATGITEDMISTRGPGSGILPERVSSRELQELKKAGL